MLDGFEGRALAAVDFGFGLACFAFVRGFLAAGFAFALEAFFALVWAIGLSSV